MKLSKRNENNHKPFFGEFGNSITFTKLTECIPEAPQLAWKPSSLGELRSQGERYFLNLFLKWRFAHAMDGVRPPLNIKRAGGENEADFFVTEAGIESGLEVSRATTWLLQQAADACRQSESFACVELTPKLNIQSSAELEVLTGRARLHADSWVHRPGQPFLGDGWSGSSAEVMWADVVAYRLGEKLRKLAGRYSKTVHICDLLLYSDVPAPTWELDHAVDLLRKRIVESYKSLAHSISFRRVFVVCENWAIFDALGDKVKIVSKEGWPFVG
jgi:hypothetical protein